MLHDPKWMSMKLASAEMLQPLLDSIEFMESHKETVNNRYKGFKDFEVDKVKRLYEWAKEPLNIQEEITEKKNFDLFFKQHDVRRGTDIQKTFPEIANFIKECEDYNARR